MFIKYDPKLAQLVRFDLDQNYVKHLNAYHLIYQL